MLLDRLRQLREGTSAMAVLQDWKIAPTPSVGPVQLIVKQKVTGTLPTIIWPDRQKQWKSCQSMLPPLP